MANHSSSRSSEAPNTGIPDDILSTPEDRDYVISLGLPAAYVTAVPRQLPVPPVTNTAPVPPFRNTPPVSPDRSTPSRLSGHAVERERPEVDEEDARRSQSRRTQYATTSANMQSDRTISLNVQVEALRPVISELIQQELDKTNSELRALKTKLEKTNSELRASKTKLEELRDLKTKLEKTNSELRETKTEISELKAKMRSFRDQHSKFVKWVEPQTARQESRSQTRLSEGGSEIPQSSQETDTPQSRDTEPAHTQERPEE